MPVTSLYAALLTLLFVVLSTIVILSRMRTHSLLGTEHPDLLRAARAHGNFAEYAPIGLILLGLLEMQQASHLLLHIVGLTLFAGRLLHAVSILRHKTATPGGSVTFYFRPLGMMLTFGSLLTAAFGLLLKAF